MIVISPSVSLCFLARRIRAKHNAGYLLMPCHLVLTLSHLTYPPHLRESGIRLCCAQQELTNSLTRPTWAKLVTRQGPVPNLPLHGAIAAHVRSEPVLGGSPSTPYRQGLRQVSPTNGHPQTHRSDVLEGGAISCVGT